MKLPEATTYRSLAPASGGRTRVVWTYTFTPRSCALELGLPGFVDAFLHPYMERGMDSIEQHILEASPKPAVAPAP